MSLPTRNDLITLDWSKDGSPFVRIASKSGIDLDSLDWSKDGSPFYGLEVSAQVFEIVGNLLLSLFPNAIINREFVKIGNLSVNFYLESIINREFDRIGDLLVSLSPESIINRDFNILGELSVNLIPEGIINRVFSVDGNLFINVIPESTYSFITTFIVIGDLSINLLIESLYELSAYLDIGLYIYKSGEVIKIGVLALLPNHKLRIIKNNITYGIPLLDPNNDKASPIRIFDGINIKSLPKIGG